MLRFRYFINLNFVSYTFIILLLIQLGFFIWSLNRGFDFTDEAFSFLGFKNPDEINKAATYYTVLVEKFFGWINLSIVNVRILRLLLILSCGSVFALGLISWFKRNVTPDVTHHINLFLFILLGSLLVNANGSQSLTYNLFSNLVLQLIAGGFLYTFQRDDKINRLDLVSFFLLGILIFVLFAVKFSSSLLISPLIIIMLVYDKRKAKIVALYFLSILLGALTAGFLLFKGFPGWLMDYKNTLSFLSGQATTSIWSRYIEDFVYTKNSKFVDNAIFISMSIGLILLNQKLSNKTFKIIAALIVTVLIAYLSYDRVYYLGGPKHYYVFTGLYIVLTFILLSSQFIEAALNMLSKKKQHFEHFVVTFFLLSLPFCGSIGTNNLLSIQLIWYTSFIFAGLYLILYYNDGHIFKGLILVLGINGSLQSISGLIYFPYRINGTLHTETQYLSKEVSNEKVMINSELKASVEKAQTLIHSKTRFSKGDPIFSASPDYYGFIYLLNGELPGWGYYDEKATAWNCVCLKNSRLKNLDRMILFMPAYYKMDSVYQQCLAEMDIRFPDDYSKLGDVSYSMETADRTFTIYAPNLMLSQ